MSSSQDLLGVGNSFSWTSRSLHVIANIGVADVIDDAPKTIDEIAQAVGANPRVLERAMQLLMLSGVFEMRDGRWGHTPSSRLLRSDHPESLRSFVRVMGLPIMWDSAGMLEEAVRAGTTAVEKAAPGGIYGWFKDHPEESKLFDEAMEAKAHGQVAAIVAAYDFSGARVIGDIGGGRGHLLRAILEKNPTAKGVLFDLPNVVGGVKGADRMELRAGDFFKDALPACDVYILMEVLHNWADPEARSILGAVRRAAPRDAKVLVIETMMPLGNERHRAKLLDIQMMMMTGGRERTREEYEALFTSAEFKLERIVDTTDGISILEAKAI